MILGMLGLPTKMYTPWVRPGDGEIERLVKLVGVNDSDITLSVTVVLLVAWPTGVGVACGGVCVKSKVVRATGVVLLLG